jgi:hypothetical protein
MYCASMYENRTMKLVEIVLTKWGDEEY